MKSAIKKTQSQVLKMPGVHCALYAAGHCLYEEYLNPGYETGWHCTELLRYMVIYDTLVDQADCFSLSNSEMTALWSKRIAAAPPPGECCTSYVPKHSGCPGCSKGGSCGSDDSSKKHSERQPGNQPDNSSENQRNIASQQNASEMIPADDVQAGQDDEMRREVGIDFSAALGCLFALDSACVLRMPICEGVCGKFKRRNG